MSFGVRGASAAIGVVANVFFLSVSTSHLGSVDFGRLIIAMNLAFLVQSLDLGVSASFINAHARVGASSAPDPRWSLYIGGSIFASTLVAVTVAVLAFIVATVTRNDDWLSADFFLTLIVSLALAVFGNLSNLGVSYFVATGRSHRYYAFLLAQPAALCLGTIALLAAAPGVIVFAVVAGISALAPGTVALVSVADRARVRTAAFSGISMAEVVKLTSTSTPLALRQLAGLFGYVLVPTLAGLGGGATVAAAYGIPHRIYLSSWSLLGVIYTSSWGRMAFLAAHDPFEASKVATRLNRASTLLGALGASLFLVSVPWLLGVISDENLPGATSLVPFIAAALFVRSLFLGTSLLTSARGATLRLGIATAAGAIAIAALNLTFGEILILPALGMIAYTLVDLISVFVSQRRVIPRS